LSLFRSGFHVVDGWPPHISTTFSRSIVLQADPTRGAAVVFFTRRPACSSERPAASTRGSRVVRNNDASVELQAAPGSVSERLEPVVATRPVLVKLPVQPDARRTKAGRYGVAVFVPVSSGVLGIHRTPQEVGVCAAVGAARPFFTRLLARLSGASGGISHH